MIFFFLFAFNLIGHLEMCNIKLIIFKLKSRTDIVNITSKIALRWMPQDLTDDQSTLVQAMAWCHQAPSHYLGLCSPIPMLPYGSLGHNELKLWCLLWSEHKQSIDQVCPSAVEMRCHCSYALSTTLAVSLPNNSLAVALFANMD